jgi:hypothetical protein
MKEDLDLVGPDPATVEVCERCFFCDEPSPCRRPECKRWDRELNRHSRREHIRDRWMAMGAALRQWCRYHANQPLSRIDRVFYTVKAVLCVLLDTLGIFPMYGNPLANTPHYWRWDDIDGVAHWDMMGPAGEYSSYSWCELSVGRGWFTNWRFDIGFDSSC